ncbi:MAG: haloacid dehalogenase-like hydrolase [Bacteroidaceae bacterium]|nr:haloacid dehalogenase-like hydrolase [Bacteroidaceae bacterium]
MLCFDFDGTLTSRGTFFRLLLDTGGWQHLMINLLKESPSLLLTLLGLKSKGRMREQLMERFYYRWPEEKFASLCDYTAKKNKHLLRPEMLQRMDDALNAGEQVLVIAEAVEPLIRAYLKDYPQVEIISTILDVYQGQMSGRFKSPYCDGVQKVNRLLAQYPNKKEYTLTVYGNSKGDIALLDLADEGHYLK